MTLANPFGTDTPTWMNAPAGFGQAPPSFANTPSALSINAALQRLQNTNLTDASQWQELQKQLKAVPAAFDVSAQVGAINKGIGMQEAAALQAASNAARAQQARAFQTGGQVNPEITQAQLQLPALTQSTQQRQQAAQIQDQARQQAAALQADIAKSLAALRQSYMQTQLQTQLQSIGQQSQRDQYQQSFGLDYQKLIMDQHQQALASNAAAVASAANRSSAPSDQPGFNPGYITSFGPVRSATLNGQQIFGPNTVYGSWGSPLQGSRAYSPIKNS